MEVDEQGTSERLRTAAFRLRLALSLTDRAPARQGTTRAIAADPVGALAGAVSVLLARRGISRNSNKRSAVRVQLAPAATTMATGV